MSEPDIDKEWGGGGEFGHATAAQIYGDSIDYGPGDRWLFSMGSHGATFWVRHADGTCTMLPDPPQPPGTILPGGRS